MRFKEYYKEIEILTSADVDDLRSIINIKELSKYTKGIEIGHTSNIEKIEGYNGKIKLFRFTDEAIDLLKICDLKTNVINKIILVDDYIYKDFEEADFYASYFKNKECLICDERSLNLGFERYFVKDKNKISDFYITFCSQIKSEIGDKNVLHIEYNLTGKHLIYEKLKIASIDDIKICTFHKSYIVLGYISYDDKKSSEIRDFLDVLGNDIFSIYNYTLRFKFDCIVANGTK